MRISDWSSDVCSSDLNLQESCATPRSAKAGFGWLPGLRLQSRPSRPASGSGSEPPARGLAPWAKAGAWCRPYSLRRRSTRRSEEHTSELQSLMRISYDVFCLKKKKKDM